MSWHSDLRSLLHPQLPKGAADVTDRGWSAVLAGVRYLKGKRILQSTFTVDIVAMVFGMPRALFPVLAREQFGGGPEVVGLALRRARGRRTARVPRDRAG